MRLDQRKMGVLLTYVSEAIKILTTLVYTPVMLRLLGQSEFGLYQLVSTTVTYLSLLSLGFGSAYVRYHSKYHVKGDNAGIARLNGMFMLVFCTMAVVCLVCGGVMTANIRLVFGDGLSAAEQSKAQILMAILVVSMAVTFPNSVYTCYVTAHEKFIFQKLLIVVQNLLNPFLTLPLLLMGYGSVAVVMVSAVLTVVCFLVNVYYCGKHLRMQFSFRKLEFSLLLEMSVFTFFIFLNQIIDQVNWNVGKFLLGRMTGTALVAVYGIGGQINSLYVQMSTAVSSVFAPRVNRIVAETDDNSELTDLMTKVGRIQFLILMPILTGFLFFGRPFIQLWAGDGYEQAYEIALLLMIPVSVPMLQNLGIEIQRAKNLHRARSVMLTCLALCNVVLSIFMIRVWGAVGAAMGTAVAMVLGNVLFMNWYYHNRTGLDMRSFWMEIARFLPAMVLVCVFGAVYRHFVGITGWMTLLISVAVYAAVYVAVMWCLGMNTYEKQLVRKMLSRLPGVKYHD